jgi:hypothetical protein
MVAGVGDGRWAVVPLSSAQRAQHARGAITRVVRAGQLVRGAQAVQLRAALIGRMLAQVGARFLDLLLGLYVSRVERIDGNCKFWRSGSHTGWLRCTSTLLELRMGSIGRIMPQVGKEFRRPNFDQRNLSGHRFSQVGIRLGKVAVVKILFGQSLTGQL